MKHYRKLLSLLLIICISMTMLTGYIPVNAVTPTTEPPLESIMPFELPDIVDAAEAEEKGYIGRIKTEEKDLYTFVFANGDGTNTMRVYGHPVKYVAKDGTIRDISLDVKAKADGGFVTADHEIITTFEKTLTNGVSLTYNDVEVTLVPKLGLGKSPTATLDSNNKVVTYKMNDVTSFVYELTYAGFKEDIVVKEYTGQTEYEFTLFTNGLTLCEEYGSYYLVDAEGNVEATIGDIIIFTADEKNNTMGDLNAQTVVAGQEYLLTIIVDPEFLASEETVYPIRIDPTVEICYDNNGAGAIADVTLNSNSGSSGTSGSLSVGLRETYGISRILMKFPGLNLSSLGNDTTITNATVEIRDLMCEGTGLDVACYVFSGNTWDESTANWSNVSPNSISTFLSSNVISYANGTQQATAHRYSFDITQAVEGWRTGNYNPNKGIIFKSPSSVENGSTYNCKTIASYSRASYQPSLAVTYGPTSNLLSNDTYYLNNRYCGDYLRYTSSSVTAASGLISSLGNSIRWEIRSVNGGYVIRSKSDMTKYLGVPTNTSSTSVSIVTITDSTIPASCIWSITIVNGGGCLVKNIYNSKYLYSYGNSVYTSSSTGTLGTSTYDTRVWRVISQTNMSGREMSAKTLFHKCHLMMGYSNPIKYRLESANTIWANLEDFSYSGYDSTIVSVNADGVVTPVSTGTTEITCKHKVTDRTFKLDVIVWAASSYKGKLSYWSDAESYFIGHWNSTPTIYKEKLNSDASFYFLNGCTTARNQWNSALGLSMTETTQESNANIKVYGGTSDELLALGYTLNSGMLGITYWSYYYEGYYLYGNSARLEARMSSAEICIKANNKTADEYQNTCVHELGHALGFFGHSSSESAVMYPYGQSRYQLQTVEKNHLKQVYD